MKRFLLLYTTIRRFLEAPVTLKYEGGHSKTTILFASHKKKLELILEKHYFVVT